MAQQRTVSRLNGGPGLRALHWTTRHRYSAFGAATLCALFAAAPAQAAAALDGAALNWPWALPFIGILLTIAIGPLLFPRFWHRHYGKLAFVWSALTLALLATVFGPATAAAAFTHEMLTEYLSFIVLLFALYVVAGGIL
jgi:Putative citrate transport